MARKDRKPDLEALLPAGMFKEEIGPEGEVSLSPELEQPEPMALQTADEFFREIDRLAEEPVTPLPTGSPVELPDEEVSLKLKQLKERA